jgi:hypothetical protein
MRHAVGANRNGGKTKIENRKSNLRTERDVGKTKKVEITQKSERGG